MITQPVKPTKQSGAEVGLWTAAKKEFEAAVIAGNTSARHALVCGQILNELKAKTPYGQWEKTLADKFPAKSYDTVCRWMRAVSRVTNIALADCSQFQLSTGCIDVESSVIPLSTALMMSEVDLPAAAREARQLFFDFTADKTIADCLRDVCDGSSPDHRIARAGNGKSQGGTGGDRKDFPLFALVKFHDLNAHLKHWPKMTTAQRAEFLQVIKAAIIGDSCKLAGREKALVNFDAWPVEFARVAFEALQERLKGVRK